MNNLQELLHIIEIQLQSSIELEQAIYSAIFCFDNYFDLLNQLYQVAEKQLLEVFQSAILNVFRRVKVELQEEKMVQILNIQEKLLSNQQISLTIDIDIKTKLLANKQAHTEKLGKDIEEIDQLITSQVEAQ
ncbi:hypothetical protein SS50377_25657 [Spironucleus salmonicida]|uniref:Uncharacterized protein n=1 Tax=Spironucleus salmonicida TaxID=348837 RepID=A0A9P8RW61_9EUKA|nr:hypothetical protein SS50377_25657 [Spironucleus salmonicida]